MQMIKDYKLTIVATVLILIAILMPGEDVPTVGIPYIDKVVHIGMFGFLAMCFHGEYFKKNKRLTIVKAVLAIEAFSIFTEILQRFIPGRSCDFKDFIADSVGIILVSLLIWCLMKSKRNKEIKK